MCTVSLCDFELQVVQRNLSWKINPDGLVRKAEQTVHFLKEAEKKLFPASLWGSRAAYLQTGKGFRMSSQLSQGSSAALCCSWRLMQPQVIPPPTLAVWPADPWKGPGNAEITDKPVENSFYCFPLLLLLKTPKTPTSIPTFSHAWSSACKHLLLINSKK